ncbi:hypothetical protein Chor_013085, partial [Crotalus horridus]
FKRAGEEAKGKCICSGEVISPLSSPIMSQALLFFSLLLISVGYLTSTLWTPDVTVGLS